MPRRVALYLRVSTGEQTTASQRLALEAVAAWRLREPPCQQPVTVARLKRPADGALG